MRQTHAALGGLLLTLSACAASYMGASPSCASDAECPSGEVCFPEGCGDPGQNLVVELRGDALAGQYARDIAIDGTPGPIKDLELKGSPLIQGELLRGGVPYTQPVRVQAVGASELIPGLRRTYEQHLESSQWGTFQMALGAGRYTVTATPDDLSVPPAIVTDAGVSATQPYLATFPPFASVDDAVMVSGRLIARLDTTRVPAAEIAITQGAIELQAFDPDTGAPLSQRFPVSSGQPGSDGNFTMSLSPKAGELKSVSFRASPRSSAVPLPSKSFVIDRPLPSPLMLQLGEVSGFVPVSGKVLGQNGDPVASAQVIIGGTVPGGGTFYSQIAWTSSDGSFLLQTLIGQDELSLTVLPPARSPWALTTQELPVTPADHAPVVITCGPRVMVSGLVFRPDGRPAAGAVVRATERAMSTYDARPIPLDEVQAVVSESGRFELPLDLATWELAFSSAGLPLTTRLVSVEPKYTGVAWDFSQRLPTAVQFHNGRVISGVVIGADAPVGFAVVRFFRVAPIQGTVKTELVGSSVADQYGRYSVVLPTR